MGRHAAAGQEPSKSKGKIWLDIEWGETPFTNDHEQPWPAPLVRPFPYPEDGDPAFAGKPIEDPSQLLARWRQVEVVFLALQDELRELAQANGELGDG
jgi:hypothetical protein